MFLIVARQEASNFDKSVVVHELELAINRALYGFRAVQVAIEFRKPLLVLKAALLFWFFGSFRCGFPLVIVILVIY